MVQDLDFFPQKFIRYGSGLEIFFPIFFFTMAQDLEFFFPQKFLSHASFVSQEKSGYGVLKSG